MHRLDPVCPITLLLAGRTRALEMLQPSSVVHFPIFYVPLLAGQVGEVLGVRRWLSWSCGQGPGRRKRRRLCPGFFNDQLSDSLMVTRVTVVAIHKSVMVLTVRSSTGIG